MSNAIRAGRAKLGLLALFFALPVAASYFAYYFWRPEGRVNYGELLEPRPLPHNELTLVDGRPFSLSELRGNWVLLVVDSARCASECQEKLYTIRQLRATQGREQDRIERIWLIHDKSIPARELVADHDGLWLVHAHTSALLAALPALHDVTDHIYLVDPYGNLMMRYPPHPDASRMVKDLKRLLFAEGMRSP